MLTGAKMQNVTVSRHGLRLFQKLGSKMNQNCKLRVRPI